MTLSLTVLWAHLSSSIALQVFFGSGLLLFIGLGLEVWRRAITYSFLDQIPISNIEKTHPHLPSLEIVMTIIFCFASLIAAALILLGGFAPFDGPYQWLEFISILLLIATASLIGVLAYHRADGYAFALLIGSTLSLLVLGLKFVIQAKVDLGPAALAFVFLASTAGISWLTIKRHGANPPYHIVLLSAFLWLVPFVLFS